MSTLISLARAVAVERELAQPIRTVRHVHLADRPLVFIPLAMAGEANAPLAAMLGDDPASARLLTVAEPRDRDQRFAFAAELAGIVLGYIENSHAPQLIVPNPAGVTFTRLLGRSTRFRRTSGEWAVPAGVPLLGRWLTFFSERYEHPASSLMVAMTGALTEHWATGQSPVEDLSLGAVLGWVDPPSGMSGAQAAAAAEDPVVCPPAGPATDPTFDNEVLEPRMLAIRTAGLTGDGRAYDRARQAFDEALATQLTPVWAMMWRAVDLLRRVPEAGHVRQRWTDDLDAVAWHAGHIGEGGPPQARRDGAVAAARRLANMERIQEMVAVQRAFDDPLVMAEYRMTGAAFAGEVVHAEPDRVDGSGRRRVLRPRVTLVTSDDVSEQISASELTSPARPSQKARVVSLTAAGDQCRVTVELKGGMGRSLTPVPGSVPAVGERVCYAMVSDSYQNPPALPAPEDTPWTHGGPPPQYTPADDEAREDWS